MINEDQKEELTKQQQKSKSTKDKIVRATRRILHDKGYEALSVKNICYESGVSNGSFFHHFKTKEDLLAYYMKEHPGIDPDRLEMPNDADEFKIAVIHVYLSYAAYCREFGIDFISGCYNPANQSLNMKNGNNSSFPVIENYCRRCVEAKVIELKINPEELSKDIRLIVTGNIFEWCITNGEADFEGNIRRTVGNYLDSTVTSHQERQRL